MRIKIELKEGYNKEVRVGNNILITSTTGLWNSAAGGISPIDSKIKFPYKGKVERIVKIRGLTALKVGEYGFDLGEITYIILDDDI